MKNKKILIVISLLIVGVLLFIFWPKQKKVEIPVVETRVVETQKEESTNYEEIFEYLKTAGDWPDKHRDYNIYSLEEKILLKTEENRKILINLTTGKSEELQFKEIVIKDKLTKKDLEMEFESLDSKSATVYDLKFDFSGVSEELFNLVNEFKQNNKELINSSIKTYLFEYENKGIITLHHESGYWAIFVSDKAYLTDYTYDEMSDITNRFSTKNGGG